MSRHILTHVIAVSFAVAVAGPMLVTPASAYANTTQVTIRAVETGDGKQEADTYDKTGGIGLTPVISALGASAVGCLAYAYRLGRDDADGDARE